MTLKKIVSGGQTGVDRAALDVAMELGLPCGDWCPQGRLAEDGKIAAHYPLNETPSKRYQERTDWNVRDSEATLILNLGELDGGTALTEELARGYGCHCLVVDLELDWDIGKVQSWLQGNGISTLNIAGPRASKRSDVYRLAFDFLHLLIPLARG